MRTSTSTGAAAPAVADHAARMSGAMRERFIAVLLCGIIEQSAPGGISWRLCPHRPAMTDQQLSEFERAFRGFFYGVLPWSKLSELWARVDPAAGWYLYAIGEPPPAQPASP